MIRRPPHRDYGIIRLNPAAKLFVDDACAEARAKCIKEMGPRWVLHQANGPRRSEAQSETFADRFNKAVMKENLPMFDPLMNETGSPNAEC